MSKLLHHVAGLALLLVSVGLSVFGVAACFAGGLGLLVGPLCIVNAVQLASFGGRVAASY